MTSDPGRAMTVLGPRRRSVCAQTEPRGCWEELELMAGTTVVERESCKGLFGSPGVAVLEVYGGMVEAGSEENSGSEFPGARLADPV